MYLNRNISLGMQSEYLLLQRILEDQAKKICSRFAGSFGNKKQSDLFGNLQEAYHQNRGYLLDYQITLQSLFEELDGEGSFLDVTVKRIDILAKYRGMPVKFKELIGKNE